MSFYIYIYIYKIYIQSFAVITIFKKSHRNSPVLQMMLKILPPSLNVLNTTVTEVVYSLEFFSRIVEISHRILFLSSSRVYSCNQITFLQSQKYGCHLWSQLQQFYGPSCNVFKTFVASASRLEAFLGALSSLA